MLGIFEVSTMETETKYLTSAYKIICARVFGTAPNRFLNQSMA